MYLASSSVSYDFFKDAGIAISTLDDIKRDADDHSNQDVQRKAKALQTLLSYFQEEIALDPYWAHRCLRDELELIKAQGVRKACLVCCQTMQLRAPLREDLSPGVPCSPVLPWPLGYDESEHHLKEL